MNMDRIVKFEPKVGNEEAEEGKPIGDEGEEMEEEEEIEETWLEEIVDCEDESVGGSEQEVIFMDGKLWRVVHTKPIY